MRLGAYAVGVSRGETTGDLQLSLDTVKCVGACALAPVVMVDNDYLGEANMVSVKKRLEEL